MFVVIYAGNFRDTLFKMRKIYHLGNFWSLLLYDCLWCVFGLRNVRYRMQKLQITAR